MPASLELPISNGKDFELINELVIALSQEGFIVSALYDDNKAKVRVRNSVVALDDFIANYEPIKEYWKQNKDSIKYTFRG
jgi:hypothetical protein